MRPICLLLLLTAFPIFSGCAVTQPSESAGLDQVVLENSQVFTHHSAITDHTYRLKAVLPGNYADSNAGPYPLIIKLDGQWDFPLVFGAYNCVAFDGQMPQSVVVGIDWGDVEGDIHAIRSRDLMPTPVARYPDSGRAQNFLRTLTQEIIPELEKRYRLNGERVLIGGSTGAIFATYALLEQPAAFKGAIAIAGGYGDALSVLEKQVQTLKNSQALASKRLYMGVGSLDAVAPQVKNFAQTLAIARLDGFEAHMDYVPGFGHSSMNIPGYASGFQHIFRRPELNLRADQLAKVAGNYRSVAEEDLMTVSSSAAGLQIRFNDDSPMPLKTQAEDTFYHPGRWLTLRFKDGEVTLDSPAGKARYVRVANE